MPTTPSADTNNFHNFCDLIAQRLSVGDTKTAQQAEVLLDKMLLVIQEMNQFVARLSKQPPTTSRGRKTRVTRAVDRGH
jgi:hypothetical protein